MLDRLAGEVQRCGIVGRMIRTPRGEPVASPWQPRPLGEILEQLRAAVSPAPGSPTILAVDGRSASGKSTMAARLAALAPGATVVHSDDVAWWESFFGWDHLMRGGILEPLRRGEGVSYRPPAWDARGREGAIDVPAGVPLVVIEGVSVSRRSLGQLVDAAIWMQSDVHVARRRGLERDGGTQADLDFWNAWDREEMRFLADDRPWDRARVVLCGTPDLADVAFDPDTEVLVGRTLRP
jgi:hypothetical protein